MPELTGAATLDDVVLSVQVVSTGLLELTAATEVPDVSADDEPYPVGTATVELDTAAATDEEVGVL